MAADHKFGSLCLANATAALSSVCAVHSERSSRDTMFVARVPDHT